jgi:hypothetical protein
VFPDDNLAENSLLIVTGSTVCAEQTDRPLAYRLKSSAEQLLKHLGFECTIVVLSDLWYLNSETLRRLPTISLGGPSVNAVSAYLYKRIHNSLVIDDTLLIQMDPHFQDLRASVWGSDYTGTSDALDIFIRKGYLENFLSAVAAQLGA